MQDKQIIIKRIRDCDNCRFRPETSKVCEIYDNCYLVSEHIVNLREQLRNKEQECSFNTLKIIALQEALEQYETENDHLKRKEEIIEKLKEKHKAICKSCPRSISCDECSNNTTLKILNGEIE